MKSIKIFAAAFICVALVGCSQQEEPKPVPEEMPIEMPTSSADSLRADSLRIDSLRADSALKAKALKKVVKKMETTQKNIDGKADGAQIRASRDEKKEGEASGGQIRKSR